MAAMLAAAGASAAGNLISAYYQAEMEKKERSRTRRHEKEMQRKSLASQNAAASRQVATELQMHQDRLGLLDAETRMANTQADLAERGYDINTRLISAFG